jgi:hypothetical protein
MVKLEVATHVLKWRKYLYIYIYIYIYINKDGNPSTKSTRHVDANVNTVEEKETNKK